MPYAPRSLVPIRLSSTSQRNIKTVEEGGRSLDGLVDAIPSPRAHHPSSARQYLLVFLNLEGFIQVHPLLHTWSYLTVSFTGLYSNQNWRMNGQKTGETMRIERTNDRLGAVVLGFR
jgi:hypothetical protein